MHLNTILTVLVLATPALSFAGERIYQLRSVEDAAASNDASACAGAPFRVNLRLNASLWTYRTRANDGQVVHALDRRIGNAVACARLTSPSFPEGVDQEFYVVFDLPEGRYTSVGTCRTVSNGVPLAGVVLAGCSLRLLDHPMGVVGGVVTGASVLNPYGIQGFSTGTYWTLHLFDSFPDREDRERDGASNTGL